MAEYPDKVIIEPILNEVTLTKKENKVVIAHLNSFQSDGFYVHDQGMPSAVWDIVHNLGYHPSITVVDSTDQVVEGQYDYISLNEVQATFIGAFSGKAYLS